MARLLLSMEYYRGKMCMDKTTMDPQFVTEARDGEYFPADSHNEDPDSLQNLSHSTSTIGSDVTGYEDNIISETELKDFVDEGIAFQCGIIGIDNESIFGLDTITEASTTDVKYVVDEESSCGCCRRHRQSECSSLCMKFVWEGQSIQERYNNKVVNLPHGAPFVKRLLVKHRQLMGVIIPAVLVLLCWLSIFIKWNLWYLFTEEYYLSITMVLGSLIAGMTSEGGGAFIFPVTTLAFEINTVVARDFTLSFQAIGMTSATLALFFMKVHLELKAILFCSIGATVGIIFGLELVEPLLSPEQKKIGFVSTCFTFVFALFLLNLNYKRPSFKHITEFRLWKACVLITAGILGGIVSAVSGSAVDICCFSVLTLLFRVSEKIATPTSIVVMSINAVVGVFWRAFVERELSQEALHFVAVSTPVAAIFAPIGTVIGTNCNRFLLSGLVYILDTAALVSAFLIVPMNTTLWIVVAVILFFGCLLILAIFYVGQMQHVNIYCSDNEMLPQYSSIRRLE